MAGDPKNAFRTHSNYLRAFDTLIGAHHLPGVLPISRANHLVLGEVAARVRGCPGFSTLRDGRGAADAAGVRPTLRNAWGTEFLLVSGRELADDELLGVANNWAVVQAYYACYHAIQAVLVAAGHKRPQTHPATLRAFSDHWTKRFVSLPPWSLAFASGSCRNLPAEKTIASIHDWTGCDDNTCWDLVSMALRTTRADKLKERTMRLRMQRKAERRKEWRAHEAERTAVGRRPRKEPAPFPLPRLSPKDQRQVDESLTATTVLDYLYRLRIRCNYDDPTMFTEGPEHPYESRDVHRCLCRITSATLLAHELHVSQLLGPRRLEVLVDEWLATPTVGERKVGLAGRREILFPG